MREDLALLLGELLERLPQRLLERLAQHLLVGVGDDVLLEEIAELGLALLVHRLVEREDVLVGGEQQPNLLGLHAQLVGQLPLAGRPLELAAERLPGALEPIEHVGLLLGQAEGRAVLRERVQDRLADPPDRVRDELDVLVRVELLRGLDEPDVALVDEVEKRHARVPEALGVSDHEPQVGLDEPSQGLRVVLLDSLAELLLLLGCQLLEAADLLQVPPQQGGFRVLLVVVAGHSPSSGTSPSRGRTARACSRGTALTSCRFPLDGGHETLDLPLERVDLILHVEDNLHARQVYSKVAGEGQDELQPLHVSSSKRRVFPTLRVGLMRPSRSYRRRVCGWIS